MYYTMDEAERKLNSVGYRVIANSKVFGVYRNGTPIARLKIHNSYMVLQTSISDLVKKAPSNVDARS